MGDHELLKLWKKDKLDSILLVHPEYDKEKVTDFLDKIIDKKLKNPRCKLHNNYLHRVAPTTLLDIYDYIVEKKPIMAGGGVLFRNQNQAMNPPSHFLDGALKKRKAIKKLLKVYARNSYEYMMTDLRQLTEKVVANSYYGASGNAMSPFFNLYTALSTTATGQSLISCMMCAFESFYANNMLFNDIDDFLLYVKNSIHKEEKKIPIDDIPEVHKEDLMKKFLKMFDRSKIFIEERPDYVEIISKTIDNLTYDEKVLLYYSSNLFKFIKIPSIHDLILSIIYKTETFKDPNDVPKNIVMDLDHLWDIIKYWVVYNYPSFNRINVLKFKPRKAVVTIDTDSNMLNINRWMEYWEDAINLSETITQDSDQIMYIKCNIICYILTKYSQLILSKYADIANIPKDFAPRLNMKNEYLYLRMVLTDTKKRYAGIIRLREGTEMIPEAPDTKGLDYKKSTCSEETREYFENLVNQDILYADKISGAKVIKHIREFEAYIHNSLRSGAKNFLTPLSVKEPEAYEKPFSIQGIKGTYVWNLMYPDMEIQLPDKVMMVKVNLATMQSMEIVRRYDEAMYERLVNGVFNNPDCPFRDKGITMICIPNNLSKMPEWFDSIIDYETIINDNISKIHPILKSIGISMINTSANDQRYSNIIAF